VTFASALYEGPVVHKRLRPRHHQLSYRVFSLLLDLDELPALDMHHKVFGYNHWALLSFWNKDHGDGSGNSLRPWVESQMSEAGIYPDGGPIRILCYPRILGYAFNPFAILYEVGNTFGERHTYVIPVDDATRPVIQQSCDKAFYVSPFMPMDCTYHFRMIVPGPSVNITIRQEDEDGLVFAASFNGQRSEFSTKTLLGSLARYPSMIFKVIAGIHWEAARLWIKRLPIYRHQPAESPVGKTIIQTTNTNGRTGKAA
jgi:DUF1365 family protein